MNAGFEGEPQSGMLENFTERLTAAQKCLSEALEAGEESTATKKSIGAAKIFCDMVLVPDPPPYNLEGVTLMLGMGKILEENVSDITPKSQEALAWWKSAILEFPMPRRFAPAVAWAFGG